MNVGIVTDSTASLEPADAEAEGITVVPLHVCIDDTDFIEGVNLPAKEIADALTDGQRVSTSRPSPQAFLSAYNQLAERGADELVSIHLSSEISGTVESARVAADQCDIPVHVVDSRMVGLATGFAAGVAARAARAGADASTAAAKARQSANGSTVLLYVDSLEYLKQGGRVGLAAALIGSALAVKPVLTMSDGRVVVHEKIRTQSKAIKRIEEIAVARALECCDGFDIGVQHLANEQQARKLADNIATVLHRETVPVDQVGAVIGAHVGPGTIAVTISAR